MGRISSLPLPKRYTERVLPPIPPKVALLRDINVRSQTQDTRCMPGSPSSTQTLPVTGYAWQILPPTLIVVIVFEWALWVGGSSPIKAFFYKGELRETTATISRFTMSRLDHQLLECERSVDGSLLSCWHLEAGTTMKGFKTGRVSYWWPHKEGTVPGNKWLWMKIPGRKPPHRFAHMLVGTTRTVERLGPCKSIASL